MYTVVSHHTDEGEGVTRGEVLRRVYLTFDANFSKSRHGCLRFEINQAGEFGTYTFDLLQSIWGFRYLARIPMDLQGEASRDTAAKGPYTYGTHS